MVMDEYTIKDCLNFGYSEGCGGEVFERVSRSGCTVSVKCQNCQDRLDERLNEIEQRYPDSQFAPAWFDPTYAGERWNDDY